MWKKTKEKEFQTKETPGIKTKKQECKVYVLETQATQSKRDRNQVGKKGSG